MEKFKFSRSMDEYVQMVKEFIDEGSNPLQGDILKRFNKIIPKNKIIAITTTDDYVGKFWNIERKIPKGYIYKSLEASK